MEALRQRSEVLKQKCERVQEVLLEMKTRTKNYYENLCQSPTDPTMMVPHWFQASSAEYETMLRIHKKETLDYSNINNALAKIQEAQSFMDIWEDETKLQKWFQDQLSPLQPKLQDQCPKALLRSKILENLDYAEDVSNEVEKSYNRGVWNRNERAKQQKVEAVALSKMMSMSMDEERKEQQKVSWSPPVWMKKIFLKKRSLSRDSFFETQELEAGDEDDYHSARRGACRQQSLSDRTLPTNREQKDSSLTKTQEPSNPRRKAHRQQSLPDLFHMSTRPKSQKLDLWIPPKEL